MEDLPPIAEPSRHALAIDNGPELQDHCFMGQAVLPAVYALAYLALRVCRAFPHIDPTVAGNIRFDKFLALPPLSVAPVGAFVELAADDPGRVEAALMTRHIAAKSGMSRLKVHARARFGTPEYDDAHPFKPPAWPANPVDAFLLPADRLYAELVPFGPVFQQVVSPITLQAQGAAAVVSGGDPQSYRCPLLLGSPFPLDAAFHIACAWAQRYAGIVAFPTAMQQRVILQPTGPGQEYDALVRYRDRDGDRLHFDLWIQDSGGQVCEFVQGLIMRDVSSGKLQPPDWVRYVPSS